jgi:hypothetical protein
LAPREKLMPQKPPDNDEMEKLPDESFKYSVLSRCILLHYPDQTASLQEGLRETRKIEMLNIYCRNEFMHKLIP